VLLVSNGFPPEQVGGTEAYTAGLARALAARGHRVQVLCGGRWDVGLTYHEGVTREAHGDVTVDRFHVNWTRAPDPSRYLFDNPVAAAYVGERLARDPVDVVHVTSCERLSASVIGAVRARGVPVVLSLTDFWFLCPRMTLLRTDGSNCSQQPGAWECLKCQTWNERVYRWPAAVLPEAAVKPVLTAAARWPVLARQRGLRGLAGDMTSRQSYLRRAFSLASRRRTASTFVRDRFFASGFDDPMDVRPYGHDIEWLEGYRDKTPSTRLRVGYIGQIAKHKGVHLLLQAVASLDADVRRRLALEIYGSLDKDATYAADLRRLAAGLPEVSFRGTYEHHESGRVFSQMDVLAVPSLWFDFPLVVHEAFVSGTPVVATRLGGMAEAVRHDECGLLFERGDAADLARALRRLVLESDLLDKLRAGIRPVRTMVEEATDLTEVYRDVTESSRSESRWQTASQEYA
jgi:glycosyltransferase involved in cell wall biosynthesis